MLKLRRTEAANRNKTILVADDDPATRETIQHRLAGCPWNILTAADGQEAIEIAATSKPDLLLLDINMPRMNGQQVLAHLRQDPHMKDIKVIMITASGDVADITEAASHGIQDYVTKPFYPTDLIARIEHVLSK